MPLTCGSPPLQGPIDLIPLPLYDMEFFKIPSLLGRNNSLCFTLRQTISQSFRTLFEDYNETEKYQVGFDFVQLPAVVSDGIVDTPVAVYVLLHRGQVHTPGHHVHLRLIENRKRQGRALHCLQLTHFSTASRVKISGAINSSASDKTKDRQHRRLR